MGTRRKMKSPRNYVLFHRRESPKGNMHKDAKFCKGVNPYNSPIDELPMEIFF